MPMSKHQLAASAYHLKPSDMRKVLLTATNFRDRCLIKTLWWLGVRRRELIHLDIRDLAADRKRIMVREGKGGKTRVIPLIDDEYLRVSPKSPLCRIPVAERPRDIGGLKSLEPQGNRTDPAHGLA